MPQMDWKGEREREEETEKERKRGRKVEKGREGGRESEFRGCRETVNLQTLNIKTHFLLSSMTHVFKYFQSSSENILTSCARPLSFSDTAILLFAFLMPFFSSIQPPIFSLIWHESPSCPFHINLFICTDLFLTLSKWHTYVTCTHI